ncbi:MAG: sodium:proton antiporter [Candidatus Neomarinimicrobiota bacterium]
MKLFRISIISIIVFVANIVLASEGQNSASIYHVDGALLTIAWTIPFAGILLSIAILPLVAAHFWHNNYGKISLFWVLTFLIPFFFAYGIETTVYEILHIMLLDYIPFIILLLSLFTISGGIRLKGTLVGTPTLNVIIFVIGTILASWMGTTGAAMLLIRPLIRANQHREHKVHVIVFFIFLVANIGGSLTPLGDPPLFLGFLKGVDFFWTTTAMLKPMIFMVVSLLIIFLFIDSKYYGMEDHSKKPSLEKNEKLGIEGSINFLFLFGVIGAVLMSGVWNPHISITFFNVELTLPNVLRDSLLLILTALSWIYTSKSLRKENQFTWFPIQEVAKLFAGIFITIIPAIVILQAGTKGALSAIINSVSSNGEPVNYMYFWATGVLSSFLDNAPTYLVFFNTAGGDALELMGTLSQTLLAISAGAVFMGANSYIGNAPNFMVKSIAEEQNISMPSFFGYMLKYSIPILIPLYILITYIFFL